MFQFLTPWALAALSAAALPILIHFLSRRRLKRIEFSSLRFLKQLEKQQIRRIRFYQWLILLLRTFFVIFLILYLSRPVLTFFRSGDSTQNVSAVVLLDNSYSMRATPGQQDLIRISREQTQQILNSFGKDDRVLLAATQNGRLPELQFPYRLEERRAEIQTAPFSPGQLAAQIKDWLSRHPSAQTELYIIGDQRLSSPAFAPDLADSLLSLVDQAWFVRSGPEGALNNLGLDSAWIENKIFRAGRPLHLFCRLRNDFNEELTATLHLFVDDSRRAMQSLKVPAGQTIQADFRISGADSGWKRISFELEEDDLADDNRYYLNFYNQPVPDVGFILSETNSPLTILSQVFKRSGLIDLQPDAADLVISDEISVLRPEVQNAPGKGAALLLVPSRAAHRESLNRALSALPVPESFRCGELIELSAENFLTLPVNTLRSQLDLSLPAEPAIRLRKYFLWPATTGRQVSLSNDQPFFVQAGSANVFILNTALSSDWSNLAGNPGFVPLMSRLIDVLTGADQAGQPLQVVCGQSTLVPIRQEWWTKTLTFGPADQAGDPVPASAYSGQRMMRTPHIVQTGQYELKHDQEIAGLVSANLPGGEFRQPFTNLAKHGFEISYWFLILAVLMLAGEMFVLWLVEKETV